MTIRRLLIALAFLASALLPLAFSSPIAAASTCFNNDCPVYTAGLKYNGGPLTPTPKVYLIRFSASPTSLVPSSGFLYQDFTKKGPNLSSITNLIVGDPHTGWWMQEYSTPQYTLGLGSYAGTDTVYSPALATESHTTEAQINTAIDSAINSGVIPNYGPNAIYMVILRANQFGPTASCGVLSQVNYAPPNGSDVEVPFGVIESFTHTPPSYCSTKAYTPFEGQTLMFSYFLSIAVTDPSSTPGWDAPSTGQTISGACFDSASDVSKLSYKGHIYDVVKYYSVQVHACLSTPLPTKLIATLASPTKIAVTFSSSGRALPGRTIYVHEGTSVVGSGVTSASGTATITIPIQLPGTRLVAAPQKVPALAPVAAVVTIHTRANAHVSFSFYEDAPTSVPAGDTFSFSVHVSPASKAHIHISGPNTSFSTTLNKKGTGILKATASAGTNHYTITSTSDPSLHRVITVTGIIAPSH